MTKAIKNLISGARQALTLKANAGYRKPTRHEFSRDAANFKGDVAKIGGDLRKSVKTYAVSKK